MNYYEVLKALKGLPVMDCRAMIFARKIRKNYTKDVTVSGVPCVLEKSVGKPVVNYRIYGNTVQNGTPSPENPVEVQGVGNPVYAALKDSEGNVLYDSDGFELRSDDLVGYEIPVVSRGKNLFDFKTMSGDTKGCLNEAGNIVTTNDWKITDFIPCCGRIFTINKIGGVIPAICLYDKNKEFITGKRYNTGGAYVKKSVTIESETVAYYVRFSYYTTSQGYDNLEYIQLKLGSEATPYEPYRDPITTPIYLPEPLYKGDYIVNDKSGGKVHRAWGVKVFDGMEAFIQHSTIKGWFLLYDDTVYIGKHAYCTHFQYYNNATTIPAGYFTTTNTATYVGRYVFKMSDDTTLNEFKAFLASEYAKGTPVMVYYPLAAPTEEPLELPKIPTFKGTTIIETATEIQPENMEITYKSRR